MDKLVLALSSRLKEEEMESYNKILIVGGIGSGKTTLARKLSKKLKITEHELDNLFYKRRDIHERQKPKIRGKKVKDVLKRKKWIMEGFYYKPWTYPLYRKADLVIILNIKTSISRIRLIRRFLKRKASLKKNKHENQNFRLMINLLKYIGDYPKKYFQMQKDVAKRLNKNVLIFENKKQVEDFLKTIK